MSHVTWYDGTREHLLALFVEHKTVYRTTLAKVLGISEASVRRACVKWEVTSKDIAKAVGSPTAPREHFAPCATHSSYKAVTRPDNGCERCWEIWLRRPPREALPHELAQADMKVNRAAAEVASLRARNKALATEANVVDTVRQILQPVIQREQLPPPDKIKHKTGNIKNPMTMVAPANDWHWGESVEGIHVEGLNEYSPAIAARRIQHWVDILLDWRDFYSSIGNVRKLIIPAIGDMFSGMHNIHPQIADEYAFIAKQSADASMVFAQAVREIAPYFDEIEIRCSAGSNHTRSTHKSSTGKSGLQTSWETGFYRDVDLLLWQVPNVRVVISTSYKTFFKAEGVPCAAAHGHMLKGGGGQLGIPAYALVRMFNATLAKQVVKARAIAEEYGAKGVRAQEFFSDLSFTERVFIGHFHTETLLPCSGGFIHIEPALKGTDPYPNDQLERYSPASQRMYVFHPERKLIGSHTIDMQRFVDPECESRYRWFDFEDDDWPASRIMDAWEENRGEHRA